MGSHSQSTLPAEDSLFQRILTVAKSDPFSFFGAFVVVIGCAIYEPAVVLSTLSGIAVMTIIYYVYTKFFAASSSPSDTAANTGGKSSNKSSSLNQKVKNIWEAGSSKNSNSAEKKAYTDKPFGSKYYYAHNNPGATGGYKDGLKMEDYRMNGPRLLSKGGAPVQEDETQQQESESMDQETVDPPSSSVKITASDPNVLPITKYLWDDPGDIKGVATIRIDSLPTKTSGEYIDWSAVDIQGIQAHLPGEGLLVKIDTDRGKYQLKIAKLYGDANSVKTVVKPKRLLVKITKKKIAALSGSKDNLDAWPQPYRKI